MISPFKDTIQSNNWMKDLFSISKPSKLFAPVRIHLTSDLSKWLLKGLWLLKEAKKPFCLFQVIHNDSKMFSKSRLNSEKFQNFQFQA